jgi:valyl-tRNA synthetase
MTTDTQDVRMPVQFECPHCEQLLDQTLENREQPRIDCPQCGKAFATQWARSEEDLALPRGPVVSERFEQARNFCNKLWNAARFAMINLNGYTPGPVKESQLTVEDRWLLSRLATVTQQVTEALDGYHYAEASRALYEFAWDEFCSFYVEMVKGRLQDETARPTAQRVLAHTLDNLMRLLHPTIPYITEEIWQSLHGAAPKRGLPEPVTAPASVMVAAWPEVDEAHQDPDIEAQFATFQAVLGAVREIRSRQTIPAKTPVEFFVQADAKTCSRLEPMQPYFRSLANAHAADWGPDIEPPATRAGISLQGIAVYVDLTGLIDVEAEVRRNEQQQKKLLGLIQGKEKKLANDGFVQRAPAEIVQRERDSLVQLKEQLTSVQAMLQELRGAN